MAAKDPCGEETFRVCVYIHIALGSIKNISFGILPASYRCITMIPSLKVIVGH